MVFADAGCGFVQVVAASVTDMAVNTLDAGSCPLPVVAEFNLMAHHLLRFSQAAFMLPEAVERFEERTV